MPIVSAPDLIRLRAQPHRSDLYLVIHQPSTILSATVSSVADNNTEIAITGAAYGTDASGAAWVVGDLVADLTVWVGSSAGAKDRGILRFKSVLAGDPPTSIEVAENDDIDWSSTYITIVDEFRVWPVFPRTPLQTPPTDVDWFADYDDAYSDQNEKFVPIPIMGPSAVGFLDGATITFQWDGSASYTIRTGAAIGAHAWTSQSGAVINGATATPSIRYNYATGHTGDRNTLKVTDDQGVDAKDYTGHRHAFTMSRTGANAPYGAGDTEIALLAFGGSWDEGGYSMEVEVRDGTDDGSGRPDADKFQDGNMAILFSEDFFGRTSGSVGSLQYREPICLVGYIMGNSVTQNARTGAVTFTAQTINGVLSRCDMYPIALEDATTPQTNEWYKMENLNIQRVLHHLFVYHSTVQRCADLFLPDYSLAAGPWINQGRTTAAGWEFAQQSLYSMANATVMQSAVAGKCVSDKFSRLFMEKDIQVLDDGNYAPTLLNERAAIPTVMGLLKQDQREPLEIEEASEAVTSQVRLSGVYWPGGGIEDDPDLDNLTAYFSYAPGDCMKTRGTGRDQANLALDSQDQANTMSGMLLAKDNNRYPVLQVPLTGNYRVFDIIPQEYVTMSLAAGDTNRGIVWTDQKLVVRGIEYEYVAKPGTLLTTLLLEPETTGKPGETIIFPDQPPDEEPYDPPEPPEPPGPEPIGNGPRLIVGTNPYGVAVCLDRFASPPVWEAVNDGLAGNDLKIVDLILDPWDPQNTAFICTETGDAFRNTNVFGGGSWTRIYDASVEGPCDHANRVVRVRKSMLDENFVLLAVEGEDAAHALLLYVVHSHNDGGTWPTAAQLRNPGIGLHPHRCGMTVTEMEKGGSLIASTHDADVIFVSGESGRGVAYWMSPTVWKSTDKAHTFPILQWERDNNLAATTKCVPIKVPYNNNPSDQKILIGCWYVLEAPSKLGPYYVEDGLADDPVAADEFSGFPGGHTLVDNTWPPRGSHGIATWDIEHVKLFTVSGGVYYLQISVDGGDSFTGHALQDPGSAAFKMRCNTTFPYDPNRFVMGRAASTGAYLVMASDDGGASLQDVTGNLRTALGAVNGAPYPEMRITQIVFDWLTT